jgi:hypothetical protein
MFPADPSTCQDSLTASSFLAASTGFAQQVLDLARRRHEKLHAARVDGAFVYDQLKPRPDDDCLSHRGRGTQEIGALFHPLPELFDLAVELRATFNRGLGTCSGRHGRHELKCNRQVHPTAESHYRALEYELAGAVGAP